MLFFLIGRSKTIKRLHFLCIVLFAAGVIFGQTERRPVPVSIDGPTSLAFGTDGSLLVIQSTDHVSILAIDPTTGRSRIIAGNFGTTTCGDGGIAIRASLGDPVAIVEPANGDLLIAEFAGRIRKVSSGSGIITRIAGTGEAAVDLVANGPVESTPLGFISAMAVDRKNNIYVSEPYLHRVRRIDAESGMITTYAGGGKQGLNDGGSAIEAELKFPMGLALDSEDDLYIADSGHDRIRKVSAQTGRIATVAGGELPSKSMAADASRDIEIKEPTRIALDSHNNLYINDSNNFRILRVDVRTHSVSIFAGNGDRRYAGDNVPAAQSGIGGVLDMIFDKSDNMYFSTFIPENTIRRIDARTGKISTVMLTNSY